MRRTARVVTVVCSLALSACVTEADAPPDDDSSVDPSGDEVGLVSQVDLTKGLLGKDDDVVVHWSVTNQGATTLSVPRWQVPSAELEENVFAITRDGAPVRYYGKLVKRTEPRAEDLVAIAPGQTLAADVALSRFYRMASAGEYAIRHADANLPVFVAGAAQVYALRSESVTALRTEQNPDADAPTPRASVVAPGYRSCSTSRKSSILTALNSAQTYATNAASYLSAGTSGARYTTWFGSNTSSRYSTVRSHYTSIRNVIQNKAMTFDCTCTDSGTYAYVYPDDPYVVYFCGAFWSAPNTGTDSRAGTIIHETSHFNAVASTNDWAYGQSAARRLATSNPSRAVDNADNHEYFAENTPSQN